MGQKTFAQFLTSSRSYAQGSELRCIKVYLIELIACNGKQTKEANSLAFAHLRNFIFSAPQCRFSSVQYLCEKRPFHHLKCMEMSETCSLCWHIKAHSVYFLRWWHGFYSAKDWLSDDMTYSLFCSHKFSLKNAKDDFFTSKRGKTRKCPFIKYNHPNVNIINCIRMCNICSVMMSFSMPKAEMREKSLRFWKFFHMGDIGICDVWNRNEMHLLERKKKERRSSRTLQKNFFAV